MSKQLAVVGSPIAHSKSPLIHTAAYSLLNKDFNYDKLEIQKNFLMQFVETLDDNWLGLSVTAPLKTEAFRLARVADQTSQLTGASNTLVRKNGEWHAFNTDVFGIQKALSTAQIPEAKNVAVLGSGATAQSAILAIAKSYPHASLSIAARNREAVKELKLFANKVGVAKFASVSFSKALSSNSLVISTLPAGVLDSQISALSRSWFRKPKGILFDIAYDPWPSQAAQLWSSHSLKVISGIEMLLWQAIAQVRIFADGSPDKEVFNEAAVLLAMRHSIGLI